MEEEQDVDRQDTIVEMVILSLVLSQLPMLYLEDQQERLDMVDLEEDGRIEILLMQIP